jgi:molybdopterin molybdotransferase
MGKALSSEPASRPVPPLPLDEALAIIRRSVSPVDGVETVPLDRALGRSLAQPALAARAMPPFDNTAVDGYAFRQSDAPGGGSATLRLAGESAAGVPFSGVVPPGVAIRISTGAVLPEGADTVAMQEDCRVVDGRVAIDPLPPKGANVRFAGADIRSGELAIPAGRRLRPQDIALLRALGAVAAPVRRRLKVAIAPTGEELREAGAELGPGQIVESNGLMLAQLLAHFPVDATLMDPLPDDRRRTEIALAEAAAAHDLILTTGGVSVGDHDHVRPALLAQGRVHFWRIAIRPGKPVLFGEIGRAAMLGLPGNPVSAFVTFLMVAIPLLDALLGADRAEPPGFIAPLAAPLAKSPGLREFPRVRLEGGRAAPYHDQSSNLLTSLSWADGILDLPAGPAALQAGDAVLYRPFAALLA